MLIKINNILIRTRQTNANIKIENVEKKFFLTPILL